MMALYMGLYTEVAFAACSLSSLSSEAGILGPLCLSPVGTPAPQALALRSSSNHGGVCAAQRSGPPEAVSST